MDNEKKTINKTDIVRRVALRSGLTNVETTRVVNSFLKEVELAVAEGNQVKFARFGTFGVRECAPRVARNPMSQETVLVEARTRPVFRFAKAFQDRVTAAAKARKSSTPDN